MKKWVNYLLQKLKTLNIVTPEKFIESYRAGEVSEESFQRLAPVVALQWVIQAEHYADDVQYKLDAQAAEDKANLEFERTDKENQQYQKKKNREALEKLAHVQHCIANVIPLPDEDEDEDEVGFDPFPDQPHPPLSSVDRDGALLWSLLRGIDSERSHPSTLKDKHRPSQTRTPSTSPSTRSSKRSSRLRTARAKELE